MIRERLPQVAFGAFVLGLLLLFFVDASIARIIAIPLIFVGIALGVTTIASPAFLEQDNEEP
jgi:disulfide bond formation protein DsbB